MLSVGSIALLLCCSKPNPKVEGYRVVSYDSRTGQWTILRSGTFSGEYRVKRMTVVCDFYKWGEHEPVNGKDACNLHIGRLMATTTGKDFLDIYEMSPERLAITEGYGADRVSQQFVVLKQELLETK
jgi:hypothetical protein